MRSRAVRITLTLLAFAAAGAAAYSYWTTHIRINATLDRAEAFTQARQSAIRAIFDVRSAQQAYVAAGQNEAFWFQKVSTSIESLRAALDDLEKATNSIDARGAVTEIAATLQEFEDADRRVRGYVSTEQRLLASDIIFSDGYDLTARILTELERAVSALHASGLVLWVSDAERKQLIPIATHGYASNVLSRLGVLAIDSENATAAAFRTSLVQTVRGDQDSNGAIAAPLVSPTGCLGVMSVEVRDGGEKEPARLAAASIVAAQLATIVGPPPARAEEPNSAAL